MSETHAIDFLKRGIASARAGEKSLARRLLLRSAELNGNNDAVWLWLAVTATDDQEKIGYLRRALSVNPNNERVSATLQQLEAKMARQAPAWKCPLCMAPDDRPQRQCSACQAVLTFGNVQSLVNSSADPAKMQRAINGYTGVLGQGVDFGAHYNIALAHLNMGHVNEGLAHLRQAQRLEPDDRLLQQKVDELERHQQALYPPELGGNGVVTASGERGVVLCVDDSPTIRKLVSMTLKRYDYDVITAADGMEALSKLNEVEPDLILLDIAMPRMDGYQVCRIIKGNVETRHIPVVMLSGKDGFFDRVRGRLAGSSVYITKPFDPNVLLQVVEQHALNGEAPAW